MKTPLLLIALLTTACGCAADMTLAFDTPDALSLPPTEGPAELVAALDEASQAWRDAGVEPAHIDSVAYLPLESLDEACGEARGQPLLGCSHGPVLLFLEGLTTHRQFHECVVHELGHSTRIANGGGGGHLPCDSFPGNDIMCNGGSVDDEITERDVAFVTGALPSDRDLKLAGAL